MDVNQLIFKKIPSYTNQKYYPIYKVLLINEIKTLYKTKSLYGLHEDVIDKIYSTKSPRNTYFYFTAILSASKQKTHFQLTNDLNETNNYTLTILELKYLLFKIRKEIIPKIISLKKQYNISILVSYVKHLKFSKYIIKNKNNEGFIEDNIPMIFDEKDEINQKSNNSSSIFVGKFDVSKFMHNEQTINLKKNGTTNTFVIVNNLVKQLQKKNTTKSKSKNKAKNSRLSSKVSFDNNENNVLSSNFDSFKYFKIQKEKLSRSVDKDKSKDISINTNNMYIRDPAQRRFFLSSKLVNSKAELKNNIFKSYLSNLPVSCKQTIMPSTEKNNNSQYFIIRRNMINMNKMNNVSRKYSDILVNRTLSTINLSKKTSSTTVNRNIKPLYYINSFINNSNTNVSNNSGYSNSLIKYYSDISRNLYKNQVYKQNYSSEKYGNFSSNNSITNLSNVPALRNKVMREKKRSNSSNNIISFISKNDLYY